MGAPSGPPPMNQNRPMVGQAPPGAPMQQRGFGGPPPMNQNMPMSGGPNNPMNPNRPMAGQPSSSVLLNSGSPPRTGFNQQPRQGFNSPPQAMNNRPP